GTRRALLGVAQRAVGVVGAVGERHAFRFEAPLLVLAEGAAVEEAVESDAGGGGGLLVGGGLPAGISEVGAGGLGGADRVVAAGGGLPFGGLSGGHGLVGVAEPGGGGVALAGEVVAVEGIGLLLAVEALEGPAVCLPPLGADADLRLQLPQRLDVRVEGALL